MNIPNTPAIQSLFNRQEFWTALSSAAPSTCVFDPITGTGETLTLVDLTRREGEQFLGPRQAEWENCESPDWWHGSESGVYSLQIRRPVSHQEVAQAARSLDLLTLEVGRELDHWRDAERADFARREREAKENEAKAQAAQRLADWQCKIKEEAARRANAELPGRENRIARRARLAEIAAHLFSTMTPPLV